MKRIIRAVLISVICLALSLPALAHQRKPRKVQITGIYSSLRYVEEAGDLVGMEVFISYSRDGYHATVQIAEGVMFAPVFVDVQVKGSNIEFIIPGKSGESVKRYKGRVTARGLTGKFEDDVAGEFLPRKKSYW